MILIKTKSRRCSVRVISFITALVLVLAIWGTVSCIKVKRLEGQLTISQQRALTELSAYMDSISTNLQKGMYANTPPMLASIASTVWRESTAAKSALSQLPAQHTQLLNTYKFLSQVGEYTMALNNKASRGEDVTAQDTRNLFAMWGTASELNDKLTYLVLEQQQNNLGFADTSGMLLSDSEEQSISFNDSLTDTEQTLDEYPTLIYDGPYSDHINKKEPELTKGLGTVSTEKARSAAAEFLNVDAKHLTELGNESSSLPCLLFGYGDTTIAVTEKGGLVCYIINSAYAGESKYTQTEAVVKAKQYLERHGYGSMSESYYSTHDGICTVNFAYNDNGIICYTDLIKVSVALDNLNVLSFDARGYIMNHRERSFSSPNFTPEAAATHVSANLTVRSQKRALIPTDYGSEVYAYEYYCTGKANEELLVYINTRTGNEEDILILLYSDGGVLTK